VCIYIYIILKSRGFFPKGFRWRDKVGNGVGAEERRLRSVQYTIQATEYHDSRVKKLDHPLLTRAATPGPSSFLNFLLYLSSISYCYLLVLSSTMRLALLRAQDRVRAPKEATIIMRGLSKFPKIRRNWDAISIVRDSVTFSCLTVPIDSPNIARSLWLKEQMDEEKIRRNVSGLQASMLN